LLYVGIVDLPEAPFLAYASFCVMGRLFWIDFNEINFDGCI
jgi:hypothetical protein